MSRTLHDLLQALAQAENRADHYAIRAIEDPDPAARAASHVLAANHTATARDLRALIARETDRSRFVHP